MRWAIIVCSLFAIVLAAGWVWGYLSGSRGFFPAAQVRQIKNIVTLSQKTSEGAPAPGQHESRTRVQCDRFTAPGTAVLLTVGQSNAANDGETPFAPPGGVYNFNFEDSECYVARDPLLGATGAGGSVWSRLGELLVDRGAYKQVLIVPIAYGGSSIAAWADPEALMPRIAQAQDGLAKYGITITHVLWHQGESNQRMPGEIYKLYFREVENAMRGASIGAPIFVAISSICGTGGSEELRRAQSELADPARNIFHGPDTDKINAPEDRIQMCHFSDSGLKKHAEAWFSVLTAGQ